MARKVILEDNSGEELIPYTNLATSQSAGRVRPDGSTISVDASGVISTINMQTTITGAATTVVSDNLTKNRVIVTNASGKLATSGITATELSYLDNVTSNIQTQLNGKVSTSATGVAELSYLNGVTSAIQTQINNCVHLSGNETITGVKTFKGNNRITVLQNSTVTYNTAPASNTLTDLSIRDKDGVEMGVLEHIRSTNNDTGLQMVVKGIDGNWSTGLGVGKKADGTTYTSAPTPAVGDNSNKIATTAYINTKFRVVNEADLPANRDANTFYFVKE